MSKSDNQIDLYSKDGTIRPTVIVLVFLVVACLGQRQTQQTLQQSVKTSTTYSTQILTSSTTDTVMVTRTTAFTVVIPKPPEIVVKHTYNRWYWQISGLLSKLEIYGNATNRSELILWDLRLKFQCGEGDKAEIFYHIIAMIGAGQRADFRFDYTPKGEYKYQWTWLRYLGVEDYKAAVSTTTVLQTSTTIETSRVVRANTLTTVHTVLLMYTEPESVATGGAMNWLLIAIVVVVAAAAVAIAVSRRRQKVQTGPAPQKI